MILRSTDIGAALRSRQRGFFTMPGGMGAAKPSGGGGPPVANILSVDFQGAEGSTTFVDDSPYAHTISAVGAAAIDADQYPAGALLLPTSADYLTVTVGAETSFAGDFTLEVEGSNWGSPGGGNPWTLAGNGSVAFFGGRPDGSVTIGRANIAYDLSSAAGLIPTGDTTLTRIKAQRVSGTLKLYVNDVEVASAANAITYNFATPMRIGQWDSTFAFLGWITYVRVSSP